jgi:GNAT superfamily N-acetyltransferase
LVAILVPEPDAAAPLLTRILHELDWPEPEAEVADTLEIARTIRGLTFVAYAGDDIVGALFASLEQGGRTAFVRWIVVDAAHRRNGVGRGLVDALEQTRGIERTHGLVDRTDPVARRFWRSRGWTRVRDRPRRELMGADLPRPPQRPA